MATEEPVNAPAQDPTGEMPDPESAAADNDSEETYIPTKDEKTLAMLCHLLGALLGFLVPLIIWLIKKDEMPFVDDQGREALNFQLLVLIVFVALAAVSFITCGFGAVLYFPAWAVDIVFGIMGAMKANEGVRYRYPINLRLVK